MLRTDGPRFALVTCAKDLRQRAGDPASLALWIGIPVAIGLLLLLAFGGSDRGPPRAKVLIVDNDDSFLSGMLLRAGGASSPFDIEETTLEDGRARIEAGEASALVILPAGFGRAVLREEPATVELVTNPAQRVLPGMVQEGLEMLVEGVFYAQRILGEPIQEILDDIDGTEDGPPTETVVAVSTAIDARMRELGDLVFPPAITLEITAPPEEDGQPRPATGSPGGFAASFFPSILFMSLLFVAQGVAEELWRERMQGTLRRAIAAPPALAWFLAGKVAAGMVVMGGVALCGLVVGASMFDLSLWRVPAAALWCALGGGAMLTIFSVLSLVAGSQRSANVLTTVVLFPLLMLGGCFFPFEAMPAWMVTIGGATPNGLSLLILKEILAGELTTARLAASAAILGGVSLVCFALSARLLGGRFAGGG